MNKEQVVITGMARTPMGSFQGSLSSEKAPDLGSIAIKGAIERANIKPEDIDDIVMGCVLLLRMIITAEFVLQILFKQS